MSDFIRDSIGANGLSRPGTGAAISRRVLRNYDQVLRTIKPPGMGPKGLAHASLDAVAPHSIPDLSTDCHTETRTLPFSCTNVENEPACEDALSLRQGATKIGAITKTRCLRVGVTRQGPTLLLGDGHGEALPSLAPTTIDHVPAALGRHPRPKPMGSLATGIAGLVRSFHGSCLIAFRRHRGTFNRLLASSRARNTPYPLEGVKDWIAVDPSPPGPIVFHLEDLELYTFPMDSWHLARWPLKSTT